MEFFRSEFERIEAQEKAANALAGFRDEIAHLELSSDLSERGKQIEEVCRRFDRVALTLFPTELGHFTAHRQRTISSKYKDAAFEQKRTLRSMLAALILAPGTREELMVDRNSALYQIFTHTQKDSPANGKTKLSIESFNTMRRDMFRACENKYDLLTIVTILSLHDTTKLETVAKRVESKSGIKSINHDLLLSHMTQDQGLVNELVPSLNRLSSAQRELAILVMNSQYNRGQHSQAEATAAHLVFVSPEYADEKLVLFQRQESNCDLAGVDGSIGGVLNEEVYIHYRIADALVDAMRRGELTLKEAYLGMLQERANMMGIKINLVEGDYINQAGLERITLLRFACLLRMSTNAEFDLLNSCFISLCPENRKALVEAFGISGLDGKVSILFYYAPALMCEIRDMEKKEDHLNGTRFGIERALRLMAKIAKETMKFIEGSTEAPRPLYTLAGSGKVVRFSDIAELRGANRDKKGRVVEFVVALTKVVKDNARRLIVMPVSEEEAEVAFTD
ncbi:TPA: hypothetical protein DIU27_03420 [Candidatus Collierbacteria bacterium]|nr:MAG: hypothetical protein UW42_C0026G0005 [Candidatus Collierbacteria bacterium GW2011_GWB1_44_197]KKT62398.1 MAG: hypothetical protein UW56_C0007G0006 [Candidatus Collierbacteria bacterium GW2011_GWD1_44_27]KKT66820.1 MAG: hypothetical protein UW58_C0002G0005 [Candidatus Collierbacteria bacterium GW2011_GWC2_44_30]KKT69084.1 MAG: hypothetical protein UW64_C0004G0006 [Microgenomates group bacterium GW2011_GWC1_44_37]HCQ31402.1 hypothetical protein [Candidatus Collierbacteria bacterium]